MTPDLEKNCSAEVRELARNYADGHFNKEEYRRRRREILEKCLDEVGDSTADMPRKKGETTELIRDARHSALFWWRVAGGFSIMLIGVMGYLLYRIS